MTFSLGDYVRFINERQEGVITKVISPLLVGVTVEGFEIPVSVNELVLVKGSASGEPSELKTPAAKPVTEGFSLGFSEDKRFPFLLHKHLVNTSDYDLLVSFASEKAGIISFEWAGRLPSKKNIDLPAVSLKDVENWPTWKFQALYLTTPHPLISPLVQDLKLRAKHFSTVKKSLLVAGTGWLFPLDQTLEIDADKLKEHFYTTRGGNPQVSRPPDEVDLHWESLPEYNRNVPESEVLKAQLNYFNKMLDGALAHGMESMRFIHGVGSGILRQEIHRRISGNAYVKTWKDAGKDRFGYGATEVYFK